MFDKVFTVIILLLFVIATFLSYASIFLPYYPYVSFDKCIIEENDKTNMACAYGESFHIVSLVLSVIVIGIIILYFIFKAFKMNVNEEFSKYNTFIIAMMAIVFICSFISLLLVNDFEYTENNIDPQVGFYLLTISTIIYFICFISTVIYFYAPKPKTRTSSLQIATSFKTNTMLDIPTINKRTVKKIKNKK